MGEFQSRNAEVFGVSMDSVHTNHAFVETMGNLNFPVLADWNPHGALAKHLGIYLEDKNCASRTTIIADEKNVIQDIYTHPIGDDRDFKHTIQRLDALK